MIHLTTKQMAALILERNARTSAMKTLQQLIEFQREYATKDGAYTLLWGKTMFVHQGNPKRLLGRLI